MADLSRSVVLNILGNNKQAKVAVDEVNEWADDIDIRNPELKITATAKMADETIGQTNTLLDDLDKKVATATADVDNKPAVASLGVLNGALDDLDKKVFGPTADVDNKPAIASLGVLNGALDDLDTKVATATADVDNKPAVASLGVLNGALDNLDKKVFGPTAHIFGIDEANKEIDGIVARIEELGQMVARPDISIPVAKVEAEVEAIKEAISSIEGKTVGITGVGGAGLYDIRQQLLGIEKDAGLASLSLAEMSKAMGSAGATAQDTANHPIADAISAFTAMSLVSQKTGGWFGWLGTKVELFGGLLSKGGLPPMLAMASVGHILTDAIIEFAAVLIPATIALGAWGSAGGQAFQDIYQRMQALMTVTNAMNKPVGILTGGFLNLQNAIEPGIIGDFGDILTIASAKTGIFDQMVKGTNVVISDLFARITNATTGAQSFGGVLMQHAVPDLNKFGQMIGNIFGILGNLLKAMPGYAEILLSFWEGLTHVLETISAAIIPVIKLGLALHGALLWLGLLGTAVVFVGQKIILLGEWLVGNATLMRLWGLAVSVATGEMSIFDAATAVMAGVNPVFWIVGAVAALTALVIIMRQASSGAKAFVNNLNTALNNDDASQAILTINNGLGETEIRLHRSAQQAEGFAGATGQVVKAGLQLFTGNIIGAVHSLSDAWHGLSAGRDVGEYEGEIQSLIGTQQNLFHETGNLISSGYSYSQAMGIMDLAGVKANDTYSIMRTKVNGLITGYAAMGVNGDMLKNSVNAVTFSQQQQNSMVTKLTQAYTTFMSTVTGSETALTTFVTGINPTNSGLHQISLAANGGAKSLNGLNQASMQLRSAFEGAVNNATSVYNALMLQAAAAGDSNRATTDLTMAGKGLVGTLLNQAKNSEFAQAQLYALAQIAGYQGTDSFKSLSKWVGNTHDSEKNLTNATNDLTIASAGLTKDVTSLSNSLNSALNTAMAAAIFQATGGQKAMNAFANAVIKSHSSVQNLIPTATTLIDQMIKTTGSTSLARNEFFTFAQATGLSKQKADELWASVVKLTGALKGVPKNVYSNINISEVLTTRGRGAQQAAQALFHPSGWHAAAGGIVPGLGTGDIIPAMLTPGERVLSLAQVGELGGHAAIDALVGRGTGGHGGHYAGGGVATYQGGVGITMSVNNTGLTQQAQNDAAAVQKIWADSGKLWFNPAKLAFSQNVTEAIQGDVLKTIPGFYNATIPHWYDKHAATLANKVTAPAQALITNIIPDWQNSNVVHWYDKHVATLTSKVTNPADALINNTIPGWQNATVPHWYDRNPATLTDKVSNPANALINSTVPGWMDATVPHWYDKSPGAFSRNVSTPMNGFFRNTLPPAIGTGFTNGLNRTKAGIDAVIGFIDARVLAPINKAAGSKLTIPKLAGGTRGAAPGWSLVGEEGPELIKMGGGETVIPHAPSMKMIGLPGYASGTADGQSIVNYAEHFVGHPYMLGGSGDYQTNHNAPYGPWDCAGFVSQMYDHFGLGSPTAGINVGALMRWGKPSPGPVIGGFGTMVTDGSRANPGHVVLVAGKNKSLQAMDPAQGTGWGNLGGVVQFYVPPHGFSGVGAGSLPGSTIKDVFPYLQAAGVSTKGMANQDLGKVFDKTWNTLFQPDINSWEGNIAGDILGGSMSMAKVGLDAWINSLGGSGGPASPGLRTIVQYLRRAGYSRPAAAGAAGVSMGEGGGNPESVGSGGAGLIGWTPPSHMIPYGGTCHAAGIGHYTAQVDMGNQLGAFVKWMRAFGWPPPQDHFADSFSGAMNAAYSASAAYERPAVAGSDVHSNEISAAWRLLANGGIISEPIIGKGMHTGVNYMFGESGPEMVTPMNRPHYGGGGGNINLIINGVSVVDQQAAMKIQQMLRNLKTKRGGQKLGLD